MIRKIILKLNSQCEGNYAIGHLPDRDWMYAFKLFSKSRCRKTNMILKVEHDLEQCAHIPQKKGRHHLHNHLGQNTFVKFIHQKKNMVNKQGKGKCLSV